MPKILHWSVSGNHGYHNKNHQILTRKLLQNIQHLIAFLRMLVMNHQMCDMCCPIKPQIDIKSSAEICPISDWFALIVSRIGFLFF